MRIKEETITLKGGRSLTLRSPEETDAEKMLEYLRITAEETHFLIRYPEEIDFTLEREKEIINNNLTSERSAWFTVFDGDRPIGNCSVNDLGQRIKNRHRCGIGIAIEKAYCGCGLGTILLKKAIDQAKEFGYEQTELGVYADNEKAISLYKKLGFRECGRMPKAFKLKDGTYVDEIFMVLFL